MTEDLWVIKAIADLYGKSACDQIVHKFGLKIYEWQDQLRILVKDLRMNKLTIYLSVRSMREQINCGFLLEIYKQAKLIRIIIDQKAVAQMWLWLCIGCPNIDLRWIEVTAESDTDPFYIKSSDVELNTRHDKKQLRYRWNID